MPEERREFTILNPYIDNDVDDPMSEEGIDKYIGHGIRISDHGYGAQLTVAGCDPDTRFAMDTKATQAWVTLSRTSLDNLITALTYYRDKIAERGY